MIKIKFFLIKVCFNQLHAKGFIVLNLRQGGNEQTSEIQ